MFLECIEMLENDDNKDFLKWCFNRTFHAFNEVYDYEKTEYSMLCAMDERFYEDGISILYERFCFSMSIIIDRFYKECSELHDKKSTQDMCNTFSVFLGGCTVDVFKKGTRDMGWIDLTMEYYQEDYNEAYDQFWDDNSDLRSRVVTCRAEFNPHERTFLQGFDEEEETDKEFEIYTRDFLHIMRVSKNSSDIDVEKFLGDTKRLYLPMIIKAFMFTPKIDVLAVPPSPKWWQVWRR